MHFEIQKGEYVAISGPSGCGKTTLLSILGLLDTPTGGDYMLAGAERGAARAGRSRARPESADRIHLSGVQPDRRPDRVRECRTAAHVSRDARERAEGSRAGGAGAGGHVAPCGHYPAQLSGGQQQRVAVARAVAGDPAILLADEPTGNLDSKNGEAVMELLRELNANGATICMVTHDTRYAQHADREVQLFDGRVRSRGGRGDGLITISVTRDSSRRRWV